MSKLCDEGLRIQAWIFVHSSDGLVGAKMVIVLLENCQELQKFQMHKALDFGLYIVKRFWLKVGTQ
jgi:hypothetical protein